MVTRPLLRAGFFALWGGYMVWLAVDSPRPYIRWPMVLFAAVAFWLALQFARVAVRQRAGRVG